MAEEAASGEIDRQFIPSLREGVDMVRMIFFVNLRDYLQERYSDEDEGYGGMLAAAVMNELFGTPNPEERFALFHEEQQERIAAELAGVAENFADLCIPLTDALRIHFLCNVQEGIEGEEAAVLARAREVGVLISERDVPLPKGFMELVGRLGQAYGFVKK
ncbi:MAG: hypothetical protein ABFR97_10210 [Thermodesulfobacteriota bacterium]